VFRREGGIYATAGEHCPVRLNVEATVDREWARQLAAEAHDRMPPRLVKARSEWERGEIHGKYLRLQADLDRATAEEPRIRVAVLAAERARKQTLEEGKGFVEAEAALATVTTEHRAVRARIKTLQELVERARADSQNDLIGRYEDVRSAVYFEAMAERDRRRAALAKALVETYAPLNVEDYVARLAKQFDARAIAVADFPPAPPATSAPACYVGQPLPTSQGAGGVSYLSAQPAQRR
jgi:hypothetical protein